THRDRGVDRAALAGPLADEVAPAGATPAVGRAGREAEGQSDDGGGGGAPAHAGSSRVDVRCECPVDWTSREGGGVPEGAGGSPLVGADEASIPRCDGHGRPA